MPNGEPDNRPALLSIAGTRLWRSVCPHLSACMKLTYAKWPECAKLQLQVRSALELTARLTRHLSAISWGALGPQMFGSGGTYVMVPIGLAIGLVLPIPFWLAHRRWPKARFNWIITPVRSLEVHRLIATDALPDHHPGASAVPHCVAELHARIRIVFGVADGYGACSVERYDAHIHVTSRNQYLDNLRSAHWHLLSIVRTKALLGGCTAHSCPAGCATSTRAGSPRCVYRALTAHSAHCLSSTSESSLSTPGVVFIFKATS